MISFDKDTRTALEATEYAQWISFAPMVFQASRVMRDSGLLQVVQDAGEEGMTLDAIAAKVELPLHGVRILIEAGLGIGLFLLKEGKFHLTKTGYFILNDEMTRVNMDFTQNVCYKGFFNLESSVKGGKPEGLEIFGRWKTFYEALPHLPEAVRRSWFSFDHFYSDNAFPRALPLIFRRRPANLLDVGGNTGRCAITCASFDPDVAITVADLPWQVAEARKSVHEAGLSARIAFHEIDLLDEARPFPKGFDAILMSQLLDSFSETEVLSILTRSREALNPGGALFILASFWDRQRFAGGAFALQQASLYFTAIVNGKSRLYNSTALSQFLEKAGFSVTEQTDHVGVSQSLLRCERKNP